MTIMQTITRAGVALAAIGSAIALSALDRAASSVSVEASQPTLPIVPPIRQVDIATDVTDPSNLGDTEPSIAVNPVNPLEISVVAFSGGWTSTRGAPVWRSTDGGNTWTRQTIIGRPSAGVDGPHDQKITYDNLGNFHLVELGTDAGGSLLDYVYRPVAGTPTSGASFGWDQPHLDIAQNNTRGCLGNVFAPWLNTNGARARSNVSTSTNAGISMTDRAMGNNAAFANRTTRIAIGSGGEVYVVYKTREGSAGGMFENAHFRVSRSDDCGATWDANGAGAVSVHGASMAQTFFTNDWGNAAKGKVARARSSDAWIAAHPSAADVYVAYVSRDASNFGQIFVARSTDRGVTWTTHRVTNDRFHSAFPEIAVTANGTVGVLYIDFDDSGSATVFRHHFARSFDHGASWFDHVLQSMDPAGINNADSGYLWGDYEGLTASGNQFYGVYTGEGTGRSTRQLDPIFFTASGVQGFAPGCVTARRCVLGSMKPGLFSVKCTDLPCIVIDPIPKNCLAKFTCPGCPARGLCPPWYHIEIKPELKNAVITLHEPDGTPAQYWQRETSKGTMISFRPQARYFRDGKLGEYFFAINMGSSVELNREYSFEMSLRAGPFSDKQSDARR